MIYAGPGQSFEATTSGAPTGLVGTIGVRLLDNAGGTTLARQTSGIIEDPAGSGSYTVTLTAPAAAGQYRVFWDLGTVTPSTTAVEDLVVTSSTPGGAVPLGSDLCTLADVRALLAKPPADTAQNTVVQSLITRASQLICREIDREFAPPSTAGTKRRVEVPGAIVNLAPWDLQVATLVTLHPESTGPVTLVANQDYVLLPVKAPQGVYTHLKLSPGTTPWFSQTAQNFGWALLDITGTWGFAAVPDDVVQACALTVVIWMRRDVTVFASSFNLDEAHLERPEALPAAVRAMLTHYRRPAV